MSKKLYLVGSDHFHHDYVWLLDQIWDVQPDVITLEKSLDTSASLYWQFKHGIDRLLQEHSYGQHLEGEFAAGIHYARLHGTPVYAIDEFHPFQIALLTNLNEGRNFEVLNGRKYHGKVQERDGGPSRWTRRNAIMAQGVNHRFHEEDHDTVLHIGGRGHYDPQRCVPLQDMVLVDEIEIIDAVEKTRNSYAHTK